MNDQTKALNNLLAALAKGDGSVDGYIAQLENHPSSALERALRLRLADNSISTHA